MRLFVTGGSGFIGTNLVEAWGEQCEAICNFSLDAPLNPDQSRFWKRGDIMQAEGLSAALEKFRSNVVIHLAARTDCDEDTSVATGYAVNTEGTRNVLDAIKKCPSIERLLVVSSQFVCRPGFIPQHETDFSPETVYGESKALSELITREIDPDCLWTIVRPTNIWGPWHARYSREFWRICARGWYVHPAVRSPVRSYGYVGNVIWQMEKLLQQQSAEIHRKVFYLGDQPERIIRWVEGFHNELSGRKRMRSVPLAVVRMLAYLGDGISFIRRKPFYITSSRLRNMTTDYPTPMESTFELLGDPPFSLEQGIHETAAWLRERTTVSRL